MKNQYKKPVMVAETFTPNNFVSSCDWWKAETTGTPAIYYHDEDKDGKYDQGEEFTVNSPSPFYFKYSECDDYINIVDDKPISLKKDVKDSFYYNGKYDNNKYYNGSNNAYHYTGSIYEVVGYPSKGAASSATYCYTSANLTCTKAAS